MGSKRRRAIVWEFNGCGDPQNIALIGVIMLIPVPVETGQPEDGRQQQDGDKCYVMPPLP